MRTLDSASGHINIDADNVTICLKGKNRITVDSEDNEEPNVIEGKNITFTGDGSYEVTAPSGVYPRIHCAENLTVKSGTLKMVALMAEGELCIEDGTIDAMWGGGNGQSALNGNIVSIKGGTIHAKGITSLCVSAKQSLMISGGKVSLDGGADSSGSVTIDGGTVNINFLASVNGMSNGLCGDGVAIKGGNVTISAKDNGILSYNDVSITGGKTTIVSGREAISAYGDVEITGGSVELTGSAAIYTLGSIGITGGECRFIPSEDARSAVYAWNEIYTIDPEAKVVGDGFFAYAMVNGRKQLFPVAFHLMGNAEQAEAFEKLIIQYGVEDELELLGKKEFIEDQTGLHLKEVQDFMYLNIAKVTGVDLKDGVEITFPAPGITAKDDIVVLHMTEDGEFENLAATIEDGAITATFTSLSLVIAVKIERASINLPKTGDSSRIALWMALALISGSAFIGMMVCGRRKKNSVK